MTMLVRVRLLYDCGHTKTYEEEHSPHWGMLQYFSGYESMCDECYPDWKESGKHSDLWVKRIDAEVLAKNRQQIKQLEEEKEIGK